MILRRFPAHAVVCLLVVLATACGSPGDAGEDRFLLEIGTGGAEAFEPIRNGDTLLLARGCQGLQHIWVSLRVEGMDANPAVVTLALSDPGSGEPLQEPFEARLRFAPSEEGVAELRGIQLVVPDPEVVLERDVEFRAQVQETNSAASVNAALQVRIDWGDEVCGS